MHLTRIEQSALRGFSSTMLISSKMAPGPSREMTISSATMQQGAGAVLKAMNHEAVHVAQICKTGGMGTAGKALGIGTSGASAQALQHEVHESVSEEEKQMELEAYTLTNQAGAGLEAAIQHYST